MNKKNDKMKQRWYLNQAKRILHEQKNPQNSTPHSVALLGGDDSALAKKLASEVNMEHQFNGDLLDSVEDQEFARKEYPDIFHVIDHPALRNEFLRYDEIANRSKLWVHRVGLAAVILAAVALLGSALTPLFRQNDSTPKWTFEVLFWAEVGGLLGVIIAGGGIFLAKQKKKWLEARMMSEVLRLWHFQSLVFLGKEIEASCKIPNGPENFHAVRSKMLKVFLHEWSRSLDSKLTRIVDEPHSMNHALHENPTEFAPESTVLEIIFKAYRSLRFHHQDDYATHKLNQHTDKPLFILKWPATLLQKRMQGMAAFCFLGSLVCSLIIVTGHFFDFHFAEIMLLPAMIIVFLIMNVATRAIQDGLAAPEELQRYHDYAGKIRHMLERFDASNAAAEKLELMAEMERVAMEELKSFLRAHSEARFVL